MHNAAIFDEILKQFELHRRELDRQIFLCDRRSLEINRNIAEGLMKGVKAAPLVPAPAPAASPAPAAQTQGTSPQDAAPAPHTKTDTSA